MADTSQILQFEVYQPHLYTDQLRNSDGMDKTTWHQNPYGPEEIIENTAF